MAAPRVLGLPGNPVSALVTFEVLRAGRCRANSRAIAPPMASTSTPLLATSVSKPEQLALFVRGSFDGSLFMPAPKQGSGLLTSIAGQEALAELPAGPRSPRSRGAIRVWLLSNPSLRSAPNP